MCAWECEKTFSSYSVTKFFLINLPVHFFDENLLFFLVFLSCFFLNKMFNFISCNVKMKMWLIIDVNYFNLHWKPHHARLTEIDVIAHHLSIISLHFQQQLTAIMAKHNQLTWGFVLMGVDWYWCIGVIIIDETVVNQFWYACDIFVLWIIKLNRVSNL